LESKERCREKKKASHLLLDDRTEKLVDSWLVREGLNEVERVGVILAAV